MKKEYIFIFAIFIALVITNCTPKKVVTTVQPVEPEKEIEPVIETPAEVIEAEQQPESEVVYVDLNAKFEPAEITIKQGTTVVWTNHGRQVHRLIGKTEPYVQEKTFKLERLGQDESINYTFTETGKFIVYSATFNYVKSTVNVE